MNKLPPLVLVHQATNEGRSGSRFETGFQMCEECVEIDKTIVRYQRILLSIDDQLTVNRTKELIADLIAKKAALHPERTK